LANPVKVVSVEPGPKAPMPTLIVLANAFDSKSAVPATKIIVAMRNFKVGARMFNLLVDKKSHFVGFFVLDCVHGSCQEMLFRLTRRRQEFNALSFNKVPTALDF
jgi:hypothetical protein